MTTEAAELNEPLSRLGRRVLTARVHEAAALLLAAFALWSAGIQLLAIDGWGSWAIPLFPAAGLALARAVMAWIGASVRLRWQRAAVWGALALATPTASATMTTTDFSALLACQLLLVAGALAEVPKKRRVVASLYLIPITVVIGLLLYHRTL